MKRMCQAVLAISVLAGGCSERTAPATPTPVEPTITEHFSGTVAVGGSDMHAFDVQEVGTLKVTLTSVDPNVQVSLGIGTVSGATCTVLNAKAALSGTDLAGTATQTGAPFCVAVSDPGTLKAPVTYELTVLHS